ncbi:MAG: hypothetical protein MJY79_01940 [Bacteroidaceae bacterium]|nr:hypothetical protein [Bacteroidaceae bacterium]
MEMERIGVLKTVSMLFSMGDPKWIIPIALCMVGVLIAAWKAPRWVSDIGLVALIFGLLSMAIRYHYGTVELEEDLISIGGNLNPIPNQLPGPAKRFLIAPICGMLVFIASQVIALLQSAKR